MKYLSILALISVFSSAVFATDIPGEAISPETAAHIDEIGRQLDRATAERVTQDTNLIVALLEAKFGVSVQVEYTQEYGPGRQVYVLGNSLGGCGVQHNSAGHAYIMCNGRTAISAGTLKKAAGADYVSL